ncbi:MAG: archaellin/type IV pilin N-terminal domain-containing protein, partial [Candidatus Thermoplasmatota archaeon]|nr:archaellin/type IV pilin N-terminal domain-containing protein [Candidatus Thermoplasmatota archaeon]
MESFIYILFYIEIGIKMTKQKISKKIGKMWKDVTGVSPIIAVILMVAITVVLAATIYVWVSGFGGGGGGTNVAIALKQTGHYNDTGTGNLTVNFTVQSVTGHPGYADLAATIGGYAATISETTISETT